MIFDYFFIRITMIKSTKAILRPSFCLKRVDPNDIYSKYLAGQFESTKISEEKIKVEVPEGGLSIVNSTSDSKIYSKRTTSNNIQVFFTTNHANYKNFLENGKLCSGGICLWCREKFEEDPIGIPVSYFRMNESTYVFNMEGTYCSFECTLSDIRLRCPSQPIYRNPLYTTSESILILLYDLLYPGQKLIEAPCFTLLNSNGGPLNREEFKNKKHKYKQIPNLITIPFKKEYVQSSV